MNTDTPDFLLHYAQELNFGEIHIKSDPKTGLFAIVAIHSTKLGPSLGGCRYKPYNNLGEALYDVMRLARGMSYKSALAGLPLGGGKSVIMKLPCQTDRTALFECFGEFIDSLNGRYITAVDSGTHPEDMDIISHKTRHVTSMHGGDPSPYTAKGVHQAIRAAVHHRLKQESLHGLHVAIQGVGSVGHFLARELSANGVKLTITDTSVEALERCRAETGATIVEPEEIYSVDCDIFSPCALGAVINDDTINQFKCRMIVGAANNQLAEDYHGVELLQRGILYGPDYLVNAGGVIHAAAQYFGTPLDQVEKQVADIYETTLEIFNRADREHMPTSSVADRMAEEKLQE